MFSAPRLEVVNKKIIKKIFFSKNIKFRMREIDITLKALEIDDVRPIVELLKPDWSISEVKVKTFTEGKFFSLF